VSVRRKQLRSITVLALRGNFFGDTETDELQKAIMDEAAAGNTRLVLNMSEVQRLNSIAIGVLMRGYTNYKGRGGQGIWSQGCQTGPVAGVIIPPRRRRPPAPPCRDDRTP